MSSSTLCQSCGHRVERRAAAGSAAACRRCRKSLVFDDNTITLFFAETIAAFFKTSLGLPLDRWNVTVRVCNKARLRNNLNNRNCREGGVDHVHTGECLSSVQVNEVLQDTSGSGSISSSATVSTSLPLSASAAAAAAAATPTPTSNTPHLIHTRRVTEIRILEGMHVRQWGVLSSTKRCTAGSPSGEDNPVVTKRAVSVRRVYPKSSPRDCASSRRTNISP